MLKKESLYRTALAVAAVLALGAGTAAGSGATVSTFFVPTSGSSTQVEVQGFAGAAGFQDIRTRNLTASSGAANTAATDGFCFTQNGTGTPTGVPTLTPTGSSALYVDTTNGIIYARYGAAWNKVGNGATPTWSSVLAAGNGSGANNPNIASGQILQWNADTGISRLGLASLALGNGSQGNATALLQCNSLGLGTTASATAGTLSLSNGAGAGTVTCAVGPLTLTVGANSWSVGAVAQDWYPTTDGAQGVGLSTLRPSRIFLGDNTVTASTPLIDGAQTWNNAMTAFNGIVLNVTNTASAAASELLNLKVGGTSQFGLYANGDAVLNNTGVAIATNATKGFTFVGSSSGVPAGTPTTYTGATAITIDSTNNNFYFYSGGAWQKVMPGGGTTLQTAYNGGNTIAEAGGNPVALSSTTADNGAIFTATKNPAGAQSGDGYDATMGATTTGKAFSASMTAGATGAAFSMSGGTSLFLESTDGSGAAVSGAATGRIRYNNTTATWQFSTQGGAYSSFQQAITTLAPLTGTAASAGGLNATAIGVNANASGVRAFSASNGSAATTTDTLALGFNSSASATDAYVFGNFGSSAFSQTIVFARSLSTASNQFVAGGVIGTGLYISDVYFGKGVSALGASYTIHGTASSANGNAGSDVSIAGGKANQASDSGGSVSLQTAITGTGTTLVDRVKPNAVAKSLTNNTITNLVQATLNTDDVSGFSLAYTVRVSDSVGHHNQVERGIVHFTAGNQNGTVAAPIVQVVGVPGRFLDSGTLTVTWASTNVGATGTLQVTVNSSLTATTETVTYTILNDSDAALAVQ